MKRKKILTISVLLICILVALNIYYFSKNNNQLEVIQGTFNYISFDNADDLEKNAQLIVIASTSFKLEDRKPVKNFMPNGTMSSFYTLTDIKVKKILKQPENFKLNSEKDMTILEPAVLIDDESGKRLLTGESYAPLIENDEYLLFLHANDKGTYCIINKYRGKFNLSKDEEAFNPIVPYLENSKTKYLDMKKQVAKKYSLKIKEIK